MTTASVASRSTFDRPFDDDLREPGFHFREPSIAAFLYEAYGYVMPEQSLQEFAAEYCAARGFTQRPDFDLKKVMHELDVISATVLAAQLLREWGPFPEDNLAWATVNQSHCPINPALQDRKTLRVHRRLDTPCRSPRCRKRCAGDVARAEFAHAVRLFLSESEIWLSEEKVPADDMDNYNNRVGHRRQRREEKRGAPIGFVRYRLKDPPHADTVVLYSTVPLPGRLSPQAWRRMTPMEALRHLHSTTLGTPRFGRRDWLGKWEEVPSKPRREKRYFYYGNVRDDVLKDARESAELELKKMGIDDPRELTDDRMEQTYAARVKAAIQRLRTPKRATTADVDDAEDD